MFIKMRQKKSKGGKAKHRRVPKTAAPDLSALFTAPHANQADFDFSTYSSDALFEEYGDYNYLLDSTVDTPKPPVKRRRTGTVSTDIDDDVRMAFPSSTSPGASQGIKFLLPVKGADGIQMRYQEVVTQEKPKEKNIRCVVSSAEKSPKFAPLASDPDWKKRVASLSFDVLESPEANLGCLRELLAGLGEPDLPPVKTVAVMASLVEIFKDVLPGYRIHNISEAEKDQQMKKDTLKLLHYEQALLTVYQKFLQHLEKCVAMLSSKAEQQSENIAKSRVAVRCMSQLLLTHPEFNFRRNLISAIVNVGACRHSDLRELAFSTLQRIFRQDRQGDATLDAVGFIAKIAKGGSQKLTSELLLALLDVRIDQDLLENKSELSKPDRKHLSQSQRKRQKEIAKVEKEMQAFQVEENTKLKARLQSQVLQALFATYFRILRRATDKVRTKQLPGVLMGVAKFAHLINMEYMDGLINTLDKIVESPECGSLERLLCVRTVFTILAGQGSALNIDPYRFYQHLFKVMHLLEGTESRDVVVELLHCVHKGFIERKKLVSLERAGRCAKYMANLALRTEVRESVALLLSLKNVILAHPKLENLLDIEFVSNPVLPNTSDDLLCLGPLWELHVLRKHHHLLMKPVVGKILGVTKSSSNPVSMLLNRHPMHFLLEKSVTDIGFS